MSTKSPAMLWLAIALQGVLLAGLYVNAALPLWTGSEVRVATTPIDPRSLFRGSYARLRYAFDNVSAAEFAIDEMLRTGEVVYVSLAEQPDGTYAFAGASLEKPADGVALRGRVVHYLINEQDAASYSIDYGIDAFFAPKKQALALERDLQAGGIAALMVDTRGQSRIKEVLRRPDVIE